MPGRGWLTLREAGNRCCERASGRLSRKVCQAFLFVQGGELIVCRASLILYKMVLVKKPANSDFFKILMLPRSLEHDYTSMHVWSEAFIVYSDICVSCALRWLYQLAVRNRRHKFTMPMVACIKKPDMIEMWLHMYIYVYIWHWGPHDYLQETQPYYKIQDGSPPFS